MMAAIFFLFPLQAVTIESCVAGSSCGGAVSLSDAEHQELAEGVALRMQLMQRTSKFGHIHKEVVGASVLSNYSVYSSSNVRPSVNGTSKQLLVPSDGPEDKSDDDERGKNESWADWTDLRVPAGSYHLAGGQVFESAWFEICNASNLACQFFVPFSQMPVDRRVDHKMVVMIRHPYDVIVAGMQFHQVTTDEWYLEPRSEFDGKSYQEVLIGLSTTEEKIRFEMQHVGKETIISMYTDRKINMQMAIFVHYEELWCQEGREHMSEQIATHMSLANPGDIIDEASVQRILLDAVKLSPEYDGTTEKSSSFSFPSMFTAQNYVDAELMFAGDLLEVLGYDVDSADTRSCR